MMRSHLMIIFVFLLMLSSTASAQQQTSESLKLQTLDNYVVDLAVDSDDTARVTQSFDIINRYRESVIPGRAKFVLFGSLEPDDVLISIGGSQRTVPEEDIVLEDGNNVVYYEIWRPISSGESLSVEINFKTSIEPQGVLFKQLDLNFGEPDIPIEKMALSLNLPAGRALTYSNLPVAERDGNTALITIPGDMMQASPEDHFVTIEYSSLPLPQLPFHGYWLWLILIVMSAGILTLKMIMRKNEIGKESET